MSKAIVDEKDGVLHEEAIFSDNDLSTYHETHAGSLVLDPVCVRLFLFSFCLLCLLATQGRRTLSLGKRSRLA